MWLLAIIFLSLLVAFVFKKYIKTDVGDGFLLSIIFAPALIFFFQSLSLTELSGFGLSGKFANEGRKPISALAVPVADLSVVSLTDTGTDFEQEATFEACVEYYLMRPAAVPSMTNDADKFYKYIANSTYAIRSSIACGRLIGVIVLDDEDRYVGSYRASFFAESLSIWAAADFVEKPSNGKIPVAEFARRILQGTIFGAALRFPDKRIVPGEGFVAAVNERLPLSAALSTFNETDAPFLIVTNAQGVFKGALTYERAAKSLLSALVES